jgi:hypothetical protein
MNARSSLRLLFGQILCAMIGVTGWASLEPPVGQWTGLVRGPDRARTNAAPADAYGGFLMVCTWVFFTERLVGRIGGFVAVILLGNRSMASEVLRERLRLGPAEPVSRLLLRGAP